MKNVGPCESMPPIDFGERLNVLTGDNGLGKSFLLDTVWWALTRRWPASVNAQLTSGSMALPASRGEATISFTVSGSGKPLRYESAFDRETQSWTGRPGRPHNPGLVIYAMVDGSFAVWDPHRNYWKRSGDIDVQDRQPAYVFSPRELWNGLRDGETVLCNGLMADWALWQREKGNTFDTLISVLGALAGAAIGAIEPGELKKLSLDEARLFPTIKMPYGQDVPLHQCSAGMRRVIALAYLLVWAWDEHVRAGELLDKAPSGQITFLVDEIECHLHPRWQRSIASALLEVMHALNATAKVQLITATHSPLFLASLETIFDQEKDAWFDLDLEPTKAGGERVVLSKRTFTRLGDVSNWLRSEAFDLRYAVSSELEKALEDAESALKDQGTTIERGKALHERLKDLLSETDPFWLRWRYVAEKRGWLA